MRRKESRTVEVQDMRGQTGVEWPPPTTNCLRELGQETQTLKCGCPACVALR